MSEGREHREAAKRRLMFVAGEDFYFLAYTMILLLGDLGCTSRERPFHDLRKIAYLADFVGSGSDLRLVTMSRLADATSRARLALLYDRAVSRRAPLERLVQATARRQLINIDRMPADVDKAYLVSSPTVDAMLNDQVYQAERVRIRRVRNLMPRLRDMNLATMLDRLFVNRGVHAWAE